eukprot:2034695-Pyramimonas_sp.AAC.1
MTGPLISRVTRWLDKVLTVGSTVSVTSPIAVVHSQGQSASSSADVSAARLGIFPAAFMFTP